MRIRRLAPAVEFLYGTSIDNYHLMADSPTLPNSTGPGLDIVIMSDSQHFGSSHSALVDSLVALLSKSGGSRRVYVAAGNYTKQDVCDRFIDQAQRAGVLLVEEGHQQVG